MKDYDPHRLVTVPIEGGPPFTFPENLRGCVTSVLKGEYAFPALPDMADPRTVLDVGANVGSFARWALVRWPRASITCFEPFPGCFELLKKNVEGLAVDCRRVALSMWASGRPTMLNIGTDWGMNTLYSGIGNQTGDSVEVPTMSPADLPPADALKIDAEGVELEVLNLYPHGHSLHYLFVEIHREKDRRPCEDVAIRWGLRLFRTHAPLANVHQQVWMRSRAHYNPQSHRYEVKS